MAGRSGSKDISALTEWLSVRPHPWVNEHPELYNRAVRTPSVGSDPGCFLQTAYDPESESRGEV